MATGLAIASMVASAAAAYNQNQTMRKQDNDAAAAIRQNMALQQQANQKVASAIQKQAQSNPDAAIKSQGQQYLEQLRQNQQMAQQRLQRSGLGAAYAQRAAQDMAGENTYANTLAGLMAQTDAPGLQRAQEQYDFGDLGTLLKAYQSDANGNATVAGIKARGEASPWAGIFSGLASGLGSMSSGMAAGDA